MSPWIDLNRLLLPAERLDELPSLAALLYVPGSAFTWAQALPSPCIVILGEAGSGKTCELRAQAERLRKEGRDGFFLRVEDLANDGVIAALEGDYDAFERWRTGPEEGWLFLDSVDEAKLHGQSLRRALAKLQETLASALGRCHVVVSCRHSDWSEQDAEELRRFAERLVAPKVPPVPQPQAPPVRRALRGRRALRDDGERSLTSFRILRLAPLSRDQIRAYAEQSAGLTDADDFVIAIGRADLWGLAGRPLDVQWLALSWKRRRAFGSLRTMLEDGIREKLDDKRDPLLHGVAISRTQARDGIERIALALTMAHSETIALPGWTDEALAGVLDLRTLLSGWTDAQILALLRLAVFDPATYGRVRFHHRTVREYLAASCLRRLRQDHGFPAHKLNRLVFATVEGRHFARPGFEAVVAWLALYDAEVRRRAVEIAPEHLMDLGDPSELSPEIRREVLRSYARRFAGRKRTLHHFDGAGLERFAGPDLTAEIHELLAPHVSDDLREALLKMIERKKLPGLAEAAQRVAEEEAIPSFVRCQAVRAVAATGTPQEKSSLFDVMIPRFAADRNTACELVERLFPDVLTGDQLIALIEAVPPNSDVSDSYHRLFNRIGTRCAPEMRASLLSGLIGLFERRFAEKRNEEAKQLEWLPLLVVLLDDMLRTRDTVALLQTAIHVLEQADNLSKFGRMELAELLADRAPLRRAIFWDSVERWRGKHDRWPRHAVEVWPYSLLKRSLEDADWLEEDALTHDHAAGRLLAFDGLIGILNVQADEAGDRGRVERVAKQRPELMKHLERTMGPPPQGKDLAGAWRLSWQLRQMTFKEERQRNKTHAVLREKLPQIRSGKALRALMHLYDLGRTESDGGWSPAAITREYDTDLAAAAAEGFQRVWQMQTPPALHEMPTNMCPQVSIIGGLGLNLEIQQGLDVTKLNEGQLRRAVTYAGWQLNEFPAWLDGCANRSPSVICEIFGPSLRLDHASEHGERLLRKLAYASQPVRAACAPLLLDLLRAGDPPHEPVLEYALQALHGLSAHADELRTLCRSRCGANRDAPQRFAAWWLAWIVVDASAGVSFLRDEVSGAMPGDASDACVVECMTKHRSEQLLELLQGKDAGLQALLGVVFRHVRPSEDVEDFNHPRYDAQQLRWRLQNAVESTGTLQAIRFLESLARAPWNNEWSRSSLTHAADGCAARAAARQWPLQDISRFLERGLLTARTTADLFEITLDVLDDIRHHIEQDDDSPRATYCRGDLDESHFQILLRKELEGRANGRYTVAREDELADGTRPDLRIRSNDLGPISVEVKIADCWTLTALETALEKQLVGQYMKDASARHGVLLLVHSRNRTKWGVAASRVVGFDALVQHLNAQANNLRTQRTDIESLAVVGINFRQPDDSTTRSTELADRKRPSRQRAASTRKRTKGSPQ
ncbi:NACHT domain-containing protein [Sorangium sp. So ce1024]|uniref:NACHT domain-containing protein n=1 Tax=Sorangium sp. So ce1024 TaxID=3133327 RepID=UPI003F00069B